MASHREDSNGELNDLMTLADLAGLKAPSNVMKIVIELVTLGVPPMEVHQLVRSVISKKASKSRSRHTAASEHASKHLQTAPEVIKENAPPK